MQRLWANLVYSARKKSLSWFGIIIFGLMSHGAVYGSDQEALWKTYMEAGVKAYGDGRNQTAGIMFAAARVEAEHFGPDDPRVASTLEKLADVLRDQKHYPDAEPLYERALAIQEKRLGPGHDDVATARRNLVEFYSERGRQNKADLLYEKAIALLGKQPEAGTSTLPKLLGEAATYYFNQDKLKEARELVGREIALREKLEVSEDLALALNNMGVACFSLGDFDEAESFYKRALTVREKNGKDRDPEIAKLTGHLAQTYQSQRKFPEAEVYFRKAIKMNDDLLGPEHPDGLLVMENYAAMLRELKRDAEAAKIEARIKKIRAATATETTKP